MMDVLTRILANPFGYLVAAGQVMLFIAFVWFFLRLVFVILGGNYAPLSVKQEWDLHGRGVVVLDPNHPDYRPSDRIRINGIEVYSRYNAAEAYAKARAHYEHLHGKLDDYTEPLFNQDWISNPASGNPIFSRDYTGHPMVEKPDPQAADVYNLLPPVKLRNKPPRP